MRRFFGEQSICENPRDPAYGELECETYRAGGENAFFSFNFLNGSPQDATRRFELCGEEGVNCVNKSNIIWQEMQDAAEAHYDRTSACTFTSFIGYEWTASPLDGSNAQNLHRNVIFANSFVPSIPASYIEHPYPEDLWQALDSTCINGTPGCDVVVIPHNSNLSAGKMFNNLNKDGRPYTPAQQYTQAKFETLVEVIQHKGQSECWPGGTDEQCGFEYVPWNHLAGNFGLAREAPSTNSSIQYALSLGLALSTDAITGPGGFGPYHYGFVGGTDTHLGTPGLSQEFEHPGHGGAGEGGHVLTAIPTGLLDDPYYGPGGLAVVWAESNQREDIFAAMQRRETYATSGPRIQLRWFAGDYDASICDQPNRTEIAYANGVPMGGMLTAPTSPPVFYIDAVRDPGDGLHEGYNLAAIDIVKVTPGATNEEIVVHTINAAVTQPVNLQTCEVPDHGVARICSTWQDSDYSPNDNAAYYARVREVPSCRWTGWQCRNIDCSATVSDEYASCCDPTVARTLQERAWSSPIWVGPR